MHVNGRHVPVIRFWVESSVIVKYASLKSFQ